MIKDFKVGYLTESHFNGSLLKDIAELFQSLVSLHGNEASLRVEYDCDDCMEFQIFAPREETTYEEEVRVKLELYASQQNELYERTQWAMLKEKYGE